MNIVRTTSPSIKTTSPPSNIISNRTPVNNGSINPPRDYNFVGWVNDGKNNPYNEYESDGLKYVQTNTDEYVPVEDYLKIDDPELQQMLINLGSEAYNVEIDRRKAEFEASHTKLDDGTYVTNEEFNNLSPEDQILLKTLGIGGFNQKKEAEYNAENVVLADGTAIKREEFNKLSPADQSLVMTGGIEAYNQKVEQEKATFAADNYKLPDGTYIPMEQWNELTPEDQSFITQNGIDAYNQKLASEKTEFEANHVQLWDGTYVAKSDWDKLTEWGQTTLRLQGIDYFNEYALKDNSVFKEEYRPQAIVLQSEVPASGEVAFKQLQDVGQIPLNAEYTGYDAATGQVSYSTPPPDSVKLYDGTYVRNDYYNNLTEQGQSYLKLYGIEQFNKAKDANPQFFKEGVGSEAISESETTEITGETIRVVVVQTPTGEQQFTEDEWNSKTDAQKLEVSIGRVPTLAEYQAYKLQRQLIDTNVLTDYDVDAYFKSFPFSFVLGEVTKVVPGTQYYEAINNVMSSSEKEYKEAYTDLYEQAIMITALDYNGFVAAKALYPQLTIKDVTLADWVQTGIAVVSYTMPIWLPKAVGLAAKGVNVAVNKLKPMVIEKGGNLKGAKLEADIISTAKQQVIVEKSLVTPLEGDSYRAVEYTSSRGKPYVAYELKPVDAKSAKVMEDNPFRQKLLEASRQQTLSELASNSPVTFVNIAGETYAMPRPANASSQLFRAVEYKSPSGKSYVAFEPRAVEEQVFPRTRHNIIGDKSDVIEVLEWNERTGKFDVVSKTHRGGSPSTPRPVEYDARLEAEKHAGEQPLRVGTATIETQVEFPEIKILRDVGDSIAAKVEQRTPFVEQPSGWSVAKATEQRMPGVASGFDANGKIIYKTPPSIPSLSPAANVALANLVANIVHSLRQSSTISIADSQVDISNMAEAGISNITDSSVRAELSNYASIISQAIIGNVPIIETSQVSKTADIFSLNPATLGVTEVASMADAGIGSLVNPVTQTGAVIATQPATGTSTITATESQTAVKQATQTKVAEKTKTQTRLLTGARDGTGIRTRAGIGIIKIPPPKKSEELPANYVPASGTVLWRQGLYWVIVPPPYDTEYHSKKPPLGTKKFATGKGSAYKTLDVIGGMPSEDINIDLGWADVSIVKDRFSGKLRMSFKGGKEAIEKRWDEYDKMSDYEKYSYENPPEEDMEAKIPRSRRARKRITNPLTEESINTPTKRQSRRRRMVFPEKKNGIADRYYLNHKLEDRISL